MNPRVLCRIGIPALLILVAVSGCAMLVPGTPPDADIRYTSQGARTEVKAAPERVAEVSANVLTQMGIQPKGTTQQEADQTVAQIVTGRGKVDNITVRIEGRGSASHLEVIDWTGNGNWDQDFAAIVLLQIKNSV